MKTIKKISILKVIVVVIILITNQNIFPRILQNGSGTGYSEGDGSSKVGVINPIESYIIRASGSMLQGASYIHAFLNRIELQDFDGIDDKELAYLAGLAFENIARASETYDRLIDMAGVTPYNREVIQRLKDFDYDFFVKAHSLNGLVFEKVEKFLAKGDITGCLKNMRGRITAIESLLEGIKDELSFNRQPRLPDLWGLNETCAEACLFGSYTARVFHAIH